MLSISLRWRRRHEDLTEWEIDLLMLAQRTLLVEKMGEPGLTPDLEYLIATVERRPIGMLAYRPEDHFTWVQIAFVSPGYRREKVFTRMVAALEQHMNQVLGFGVRASNETMRSAMEKLGYQQRTLFYFTTGEPSHGGNEDRMDLASSLTGGPLGVQFYNDAPERTKADMLALCDRCIVEARKENT